MISVIMPVYNSSLFLNESLESILCQTEQDIEVIIINDGSTDNSEEIILSFNDSRIKYYKQSNLGVASARNKGLELARGEYIAFHDSDDISLPHRLERLKSKFTNNNIGLVHSDAMLINETGTSMGYWLAHNIDQLRLLRFFIKIGSPIIGATVMVRRDVISNLAYDTALSIGEDNNMLYQLLKDWDHAHVSEPLYLYRKHSSNSTKKVINHLHLIKLINSFTLQELVPEIAWSLNSEAENEIAASAIMATFLFKRGVIEEGEELLNNTLLASDGTKVQLFVIALTKIVLGKYAEAVELLLKYERRDHIIENYIGEALAYMGKFDEAQNHFMKSLLLKPDYSEPIDNLKSIGGINNMNLLDRSWLKFYK